MTDRIGIALGVGIRAERLEDAMLMLERIGEFCGSAQMEATGSAASVAFRAFVQKLSGAEDDEDRIAFDPIAALVFADLVASFALNLMARHWKAEVKPLEQTWAACLAIRYGIFALADVRAAVAAVDACSDAEVADAPKH